MSNEQTIGNYRIRGQLRRGSLATLYRGGREGAVAGGADEDVAIQVCAVDDVALRGRFRAAAVAALRLRHEHIVQIEEVGEQDGLPYLVQELLSGDDLRSLLVRGEMPESSVLLTWLEQIARALAYAHRQGVVHGGLQPSQVLIGEDGKIKLVGFGTAHLARASSTLLDSGMPVHGLTYHRLANLAPEQVRGKGHSARSDIYGFGVLAFELLTGELPFTGRSLSGLVYKILYQVPPPVIGLWSGCPEVLSDLIARCLEKDPAQRWPACGEIADRIAWIATEAGTGRWPVFLDSSPPRPSPAAEDDARRITAQELEDTARQIAGRRDAAKAGDPEATRWIERLLEDVEPTPEYPARDLENAPTRRLSAPRWRSDWWVPLLLGVLLLITGWVVLRPPEAPSEVSAPPPPAPPPPAPLVVVTTGEVVVRATPWAELVGVIDDFGLRRQDAALGAATPLRLDLPTGRWTLELAHPGAPQGGRCVVEARSDALAVCDVDLLPGATTIDYFREVGWWR